MPKKKPKVKIDDVSSERELIEVNSAPRKVPDPDWRFTDAEGVTHKWDGDELHTLEQRLVNRYWCHDCDDYHEEFEWIVPATNEVVEPGYVTLPHRKDFIAGPLSTWGTFLHLSGEIGVGDILTAAEVEWPEGIEPESKLVGSIQIDRVDWNGGQAKGAWVAVAPGWGM